MKLSRRARRMQRHHNRNIVAKLNIVSLMDIFTILVFFLLVNSSNNEQFSTPKAITLPESTADNTPQESLTLFVDANNIYVQDQFISDISSVLDSSENIIPALKKELDSRYKKLSIYNGIQNSARAITIQGDKKVPYQILKKIMTTCSSSQYSNISLAVQQKSVRADS